MRVEICDLSLGAGGERLTYVPCLSNGEDAIDLLETIVLDRLTRNIDKSY